MADACYCDNEDPASVFEATDVMQARKEMVCDECHRAILPGESYRHIWGVWPTIDGPATYRTCARCMVLEEFIKAHVPCACLYLGYLHGSAADEIENGAPDTDVLRPEYEALMADIHAQPKPQNRERNGNG